MLVPRDPHPAGPAGLPLRYTCGSGAGAGSKVPRCGSHGTPAPDLLRERESRGTELDYLVPHESRTRKQMLKLTISFY